MSNIFRWNVGGTGGSTVTVANCSDPADFDAVIVTGLGIGCYAGVGNKWGYSLARKIPIYFYVNNAYYATVNTGETVRYAAQGGDLIELFDTSPLDIPTNPFDDAGITSGGGGGVSGTVDNGYGTLPSHIHSSYELTLNYIGVVGNPDPTRMQNSANSILWVIGYECTGCVVTPSTIVFSIDAKGTPVIPIAALIAVVVAAAVIIITGWNIKAINADNAAVAALKEKAAAMNTEQGIISELTKEYNNGLIDQTAYTNLLKALSTQTSDITGSTLPSVTPSDDSISGVLKSATPLMLLALAAMMLRK